MNARLDDLRDEYTYRVNMLLELGREDLAAQVADQYPEDVARAQQG
ncbi:MAG: hypothetical protein JWO57_3792 [Pseudonocardiales bacterium]|nr:hypothetical protein [Pseudonocardiales bacterium]